MPKAKSKTKAKRGIAGTIRNTRKTLGKMLKNPLAFFLEPMNSYLNRFVAPRLVYVHSDSKTESQTRSINLSPLTQTLGAGFLALLIAWGVFSGALVFIQSAGLNTPGKSDVFSTAYQNRLDQLLDERDQRTKEAATAQKRFYLALNEISAQQTDLLKAEQERRELRAGIQAMQEKLQTALTQRDAAQQDAQELRQTLRANNDETQYSEVEKTQDLLRIMTAALTQSTDQRDEMRQQTIALEDELAKLEKDVHLIKERGNQILSQVGDATSESLIPLENSLKQKGINIESLLQEIRLGYSGIGGPAGGLVFSQDPFQAEMFAPAGKVLNDLDRLSLLQVGVKKIPLAHPVAGRYRYTSGYGMRTDPFDGQLRLHRGRDFAGARNTNIVATGDGVVIFAGRDGGYGKLVKIRHSQGFVSHYAHLNKILVKRGQKVELGEHIGEMGSTGRSTGTHLHYEVHYNGRAVNPAKYMRRN